MSECDSNPPVSPVEEMEREGSQAISVLAAEIPRAGTWRDIMRLVDAILCIRREADAQIQEIELLRKDGVVRPDKPGRY